MKKAKNHVWLVLGIVTIVLGILLPFVFMHQSTYYKSEKVEADFNTTYNITIYSKEEFQNIQNVIITFSCSDNVSEKYEVYSIKTDKEKNKYTYKIQCVVMDDLIENISKVELVTSTETIQVGEKFELSAKISIAVFICIVGGFMIFVHFFNNSSRNRTLEVKEIIGHSIAENTNYNNDENLNINDLNSSQENNFKEIVNQKESLKACDYCGSLTQENETVCSSCGAKFKKKD